MSETVVSRGSFHPNYVRRGEISVPHARVMWFRSLIVTAAFLSYYLLDRLTFIFLDAWMLESLGLSDVFWTNFRTGAVLFVIGFIGPAVGISAPAIFSRIDPYSKRIVVLLGVMAGFGGGYFLATNYREFLLFFGGVEVGETDPVFGKDIGFYMFRLPAIWTIWTAVTVPLVLGLFASVLCRYTDRRAGEATPDRRTRISTAVATPLALVSLALIGTLAAVGIWLSRYGFLWNENDAAVYFNGAEYIDVTGLFSYVNYTIFSALLVLVFTALVVFELTQWRRDRQIGVPGRGLGRVGYALAAVVALDFAFAAVVGIRDSLFVSPNEPVIQLPYIQRHIDGTLRGWDLENVETVEIVPLDSGDPLPAIEELLASPTIRNAPLWPGWVSYFERLLDPQHADRVLLTGGDPTVYGPTLDIFRAQQKLRTYYDFMDIDIRPLHDQR